MLKQQEIIVIHSVRLSRFRLSNRSWKVALITRMYTVPLHTVYTRVLLLLTQQIFSPIAENNLLRLTTVMTITDTAHLDWSEKL